MLTDLSDTSCPGIKKMESVYLDDSLEIRHLTFGKPFPHDVIDKKYLRL